METEIGLMRCRYCNIALAPLRSLADGEFCCDDHRAAFSAQQTQTPEAVAEPIVAVRQAEPEPDVAAASQPEPEVPAAVQMIRLKFAPPASAAPPVPQPPPVASPKEIVFLKEPELPEAPEPVLEPLEPVGQEFEAASGEPVYEEPAHEEPVYEEPVYDEASQDTSPHAARDVAASWKWIRSAWKGAPRDLKVVTLLLPILAALAVPGSFPRVPIKTVAPARVAEMEKAVDEQWKNVAQTISNRAAIAYADDFRSGLDAWQSRSNLTTSWSYDAAGFVRPGPLALFKPSLDLADYRVEFLGEIDQRAMGWVFRAEDLKNYYAMKLVVVKPGPLPLVDLVRYAVIDGKEGPQIHKPLPMTVRADMLYRVMVDVRGADFTVMAQGQVVDFWTDHRLQHGGVGFFSNRGERARLRWVEVSHQYDALGRVCAYLAPFGMEGRNGSFN